MLEGVGDVVHLHDLQRAISRGVSEAQSIVQSITQLQLEMGRPKRAVDPLPILEDDVAGTTRRSGVRCFVLVGFLFVCLFVFPSVMCVYACFKVWS